MRPCMFFLLFYFYSCYHGFLLDDRTQAPTKETSIISEGHYTLLLNLLVEEKQSRLRLEEKFQQLQNELLSTQDGVTQIYHSVNNNSKIVDAADDTLELLNSSFRQLQHEHEMLKLAFIQLEMNHTALQKHSAEVEHVLYSLKQLQGIADRQSILNIQNKTNHLEAEIQITNNKLNLMTNDADARKQDFIALFNKAEKTQNELINITSKFAGQLSTIDARQNRSNIQFKSEIEDRIDTIELKQNISSNDFRSELHKMSNKVAVTAWAKQKSYLSDSIILFPTFHISKGINGSETVNMGKTGKFSCEKPGLYLISAAIMTTKDGGIVLAYKNNNMIARTYFSVNSYQTSPITVLEYLAAGDTIYIKTSPYDEMFIYGDLYSCITILQITED